MAKHDFTLHTDPLRADGHRALVVSDLHIGHSESRYEEGWNFIVNAVSNGEYDTLVIGGDMTDREPYSKGKKNEEHTELLEYKLCDLLTRANLKIRFVTGNHDLAAEFQERLEELHREFGDRFVVCDILRMGDALFCHGDNFEKHVPKTPDQLKNLRRNRLNALVLRPTRYEETKIEALEKLLADGLEKKGEDFGAVRHVFFGHIHPFVPAKNMPHNDREYHITGCSFTDSPNSILGVTFDDAGVTGVKEVFSQPAVALSSHGWNPDTANEWQARARKATRETGVEAVR